MLERLAADSSFGVPLEDLQAAAEPSRYVGRAPMQVDEFLAETVQPWLDAQPALSETVDSIRV
jgi:adenylosuccinate lyase